MEKMDNELETGGIYSMSLVEVTTLRKPYYLQYIDIHIYICIPIMVT